MLKKIKIALALTFVAIGIAWLFLWETSSLAIAFLSVLPVIIGTVMIYHIKDQPGDF